MNEKKKIPIVKYMSYLLVVSILFTGVTFSRYTMSMSGDLETPLSRFYCSYEVDDISAMSIPNVNYWLNNGSAASTARTLRYTLSNEKNGIISDTDVQGHLRMYLPAEMASHLAFQLGTLDAVSGTMTSCTPEIVFEELIFAKTLNDDGEAVIDRTNYLSHDQETVNTADFKDYFDDGLQEAADETLVVNGTLSPSASVRTLTAHNTGGTGIALSISASRADTNYSLGFQRGKNENDYQPQLYLDLSKNVEFYTIDVTLPSMLLEGGTLRKETYIVYLTLTERVNEADFVSEWTADDAYLISDPPVGNEYYYKDAEVLGYHFDQSAAYYGKDTETIVRVQCHYDGNGGYDVSVYHVAPISEDSTANYVHPITPDGGAITYDVSSKTFTNTMTTGVCSNNGDPIDLSGLDADPFAGGTMDAFRVLSKSYEVSFTALFVQASD